MQPQFNLLQKTLGMAEGVARELSPGSNIWELAGPLAADWKAGQTGLRLRVARTAQDLAKLVRLLPDFLEQLERQQNSPPAPSRPASGWALWAAGLAGIAGGILLTLALLGLMQ